LHPEGCLFNIAPLGVGEAVIAVGRPTLMD
jgi:hypothetical protein